MSAFDFWLQLGDVELVNAARTEAYTLAGRVSPHVAYRAWVDCPALGSTIESLKGAVDPAQPVFTRYGMPGDTWFGAPWYDPANPTVSSDFAGLLVESASLSAPMTRDATAKLSGGAALSAIQRQGRVLTVAGWLLGRTPLAIDYGLRWLSASLTGYSTVGSGPGVDTGPPVRPPLRRLRPPRPAVPGRLPRVGHDRLRRPGGDRRTASVGDRLPRRLVRVGVITGPEVVDEVRSADGDVVMTKVQFQLESEDPHIYHEPDPVDLSGVTWEGVPPAVMSEAKTASTTGATSLTVDRPDPQQVDNLLFVTVVTPGSTAVTADISFQTRLIGTLSTGGGAGDVAMRVYARHSVAIEDANYTWMLSPSSPATIIMSRWTNVHSTGYLGPPPLAAFVGDAGDLEAPTVFADFPGPVLHFAAVRSTTDGNITFGAPAGYTFDAQKSIGVAGSDVAQELSDVSGYGAFGQIAAATATASTGSGTRVAGHAVIHSNELCLTEWIITDGEAVSGGPNCVTPVELRIPDCDTGVVPPRLPRAVPSDCFCTGFVTVRECVLVDPADALKTTEYAVRITVEGSTAPTRLAVSFYKQGDPSWDPTDPPDCPTVDDRLCPDAEFVLPSLAADETIVFDGMRMSVVKQYPNSDGDIVQQADQWVGTSDGSPVVFPVLCGPTCICFDLDYSLITDDDGVLLDLPTITLETIRREL